MKVICFGDSNTYGYDPRSYFGGRYEEPWPEHLARKSGWKVINQGENGRQIPSVSVSFPEDTDLLILMLGTNDLLNRHTPEAMAWRMEKFLREINLDKKKILLMDIPAMNPGEWVQDQKLLEDAVVLGGLYAALAQRLGVRFVSLCQNQPTAYDGVHMTQAGHMELAEKLYNYLQKENISCWKRE